jgi:hypothetical protein
LLQKLLERTKEMGRLLSSGPRNVMKIAPRGRSQLMTLTPLISARPDLDRVGSYEEFLRRDACNLWDKN